MKKIQCSIVFIFVLFFLTGCSRSGSKDFVVSTIPIDGSTADSTSNITVRFRYDMDPSTLNQQNIKIEEGKHSSDISDLFTYSYDQNSRELHIDFIFEGGGVGTGNSVAVTLSKAIKTIDNRSMSNVFVFSYST